MKPFISIITITLLTVIVIPLTAQSWLWAEGFTNQGCHSDKGNSITFHPNGDIYCTGSYGVACSEIADNETIFGASNGNSYFTSFTQNGTFLGITNAPAIFTPPGNNYVDFAGKLTVDDSGYLYNAIEVTGSGTVDTIYVSGYNSYVLSKWNPSNRCLWIKAITGLHNITFSNGYLYGLGLYQQASIAIDTFQLYDAANKTLGYLTKLDKQGNCKWLKQAVGGNINFNYIQSNDNRIYACAQTDSCFNYDTISICGQTGIGVGLLIQTDTDGLVKWRRTFTCASFGYGAMQVGLDAANNCYLTGYFDSTFYIGEYTLLKGVGHPYDMFIAKYDSSGNLLWIKQVGCSGQSVISSIHVNPYGYLYITGGLHGKTIFGTDTIDPPGGQSGIIARFTPTGSLIGFATMGDAGGADIAEDSVGDAYITGEIGTSATFGSISLSGGAFGDFFAAKLSAIVDTSTGFNLLPPTDSLLQIYANPSRGLFTVVVPQSIVQASNGNLMVYDSQGGLITNQQVDISGTHVQVDLGEITRGVYTVLLSANGKEFRGRVVIQ